MHLHDATNTLRLGAPLATARGVVILVHGRGSSADHQLRVYNASRDAVEVARAIADATEALPAKASTVGS